MKVMPSIATLLTLHHIQTVLGLYIKMEPRSLNGPPIILFKMTLTSNSAFLVSVPITAYPAALTNMSHTGARLSAAAPLAVRVTTPVTVLFLTPVTSSSPTGPAVALLPTTHVSSMTPSSTSTAVALLATSLGKNTESPSTSPQHEFPQNGILPTPEAVASSTGMKSNQKQ